MCIDLKIYREMKDEKRKAKYELGNFYQQYDIDTIPPSRRHKIKMKNIRKTVIISCI